MEEFIQSVTEKLGIPAAAANSATGSILNMVKGQLPENDFSNMLNKLPGAEKLVAAAGDPDESESGGVLGGIGKMASGLLGGGAASGLDAIKSLKDAGLGADKASSFVSMLVNFIRSKAGDGIVDTILSKVPALKAIIG